MATTTEAEQVGRVRLRPTIGELDSMMHVLGDCALADLADRVLVELSTPG
jgi:hypothetical protein